MRARDRHVALVLAGMLALNVLTSLCAVTGIAIYRRRFKALSEDLAVTIKTSEKSAIDAASSALTLLDMVRDGSYSVDENALPPPVILGYGQTRSKGAFYIYRDVRDSDGIVRREMVQRIPFKAK